MSQPPSRGPRPGLVRRRQRGRRSKWRLHRGHTSQGLKPTGKPAGKPNSRAACVVNLRTAVVGSTDGSWSALTPTKSSACESPLRRFSLSSPVPEALESSVTSSPVRWCSTWFLRPAHHRTWPASSGSCRENQTSLTNGLIGCTVSGFGTAARALDLVDSTDVPRRERASRPMSLAA